MQKRSISNRNLVCTNNNIIFLTSQPKFFYFVSSHTLVHMTNSQTLEAWQTQMNDQTREFEILDNILSYQMTNDLNVCQLVNKKWFSESQKHKHGNATVPIFCEYYNRDPQPLGIANGNRFYPSMKTLIDHSNTCITKYFRTAQK
jgi:hypothetical protein